MFGVLYINCVVVLDVTWWLWEVCKVFAHVYLILLRFWMLFGGYGEFAKRLRLYVSNFVVVLDVNWRFCAACKAFGVAV